MKQSFNKWALGEWDSCISSVFTMQHNSLLMNQKIDLVKKISENQQFFYEKITLMILLQTSKEKKKIQMTSTGHKRGDTTIDLTEIKRIIR